MPWPAIPGHPEVNRFARSAFYLLQSGDKQFVVKFNYSTMHTRDVKKHKVYVFSRLADNDRTIRSPALIIFLDVIKKEYQVRRLELKDLPLFVGLPNQYPEMKAAFQRQDCFRLKRVRKRMRESRIQKM